MKDMVGQIMRYEEDEMELDEIVELFQDLIDSGLAWKLQGHYGRMASRLIETGMCRPGAKGAKS